VEARREAGVVFCAGLSGAPTRQAAGWLPGNVTSRVATISELTRDAKKTIEASLPLPSMC
jgi:hypothetical protein